MSARAVRLPVPVWERSHFVDHGRASNPPAPKSAPEGGEVWP